MIRTELLIALLLSLSDVASAQCRNIVPESREMTAEGRALLSVSAGRGTMLDERPNTSVAASLMREDRTGPLPNARILHLWMRSDSVWLALRLEPSNAKAPNFASVIGRDGPLLVPGTNIDVLTEWQVSGETVPHCSLLRSTLSAYGYQIPTVIARQSTRLDSASLVKNVGQLVVVLRDANNPLLANTEKFFVVLDTASPPDMTVTTRDYLVRETTSTARFDQLPPRVISLSVSGKLLTRLQILVNIVAGCEIIVEAYMPPATMMHGPPQTPAHATVTTCAKPTLSRRH